MIRKLNLIHLNLKFHLVFAIAFFFMAFVFGDGDGELLSFSIFTLIIFAPSAILLQIIILYLIDKLITLNLGFNLLLITIVELIALDVLIQFADGGSAIVYLIENPGEYIKIMRGAIIMQFAIVISPVILFVLRNQWNLTKKKRHTTQS